MSQADTNIASPTAQNKVKAKPQAKTAQTASRRQQVRQAITLEAVMAIAPNIGKADRMVATYGLNPVDYAAIRESTEEYIVRSANELVDNIDETGMKIHLQRIVGAFVSSAYGAAQYYRNKQLDAKALHTKLLNDDRDGDSDGVAGFLSKAERAAVFAAKKGLQAFALTAAAEGAVHAYAHMIGDEWKPYESAMPDVPTVQRQSLTAMMAALED